MIEILETKDSNVIEVKIIEEATEADIENVMPVLETHTAENADPRLLLIIEGMKEWSDAVGLWSDLGFDGDKVNAFERIALVGDPSWKGWLTSTIESLVSIDLKFFGLPDLEHARTWVRQ